MDPHNWNSGFSGLAGTTNECIYSVWPGSTINLSTSGTRTWVMKYWCQRWGKQDGMSADHQIHLLKLPVFAHSSFIWQWDVVEGEVVGLAALWLCLVFSCHYHTRGFVSPWIMCPCQSSLGNNQPCKSKIKCRSWRQGSFCDPDAILLGGLSDLAVG